MTPKVSGLYIECYQVCLTVLIRAFHQESTALNKPCIQSKADESNNVLCTLFLFASTDFFFAVFLLFWLCFLSQIHNALLIVAVPLYKVIEDSRIF